MPINMSDSTLRGFTAAALALMTVSFSFIVTLSVCAALNIKSADKADSFAPSGVVLNTEIPTYSAAAETLVSDDSTQRQDNNAAGRVSAIATSILWGITPLLSTVVNCVVAGCFYNPIRERIRQLRDELEDKDQEIALLTIAGEEIKPDPTGELNAINERMYRTYLDQLAAQMRKVRNDSRKALAKRLNAEPDEISELSYQENPVFQPASVSADDN